MIGSYLTDTVDLLRETLDAWNMPTTVTIASGTAARVEDRITIVRGQDGKEFTSEVHIMMRTSAVLDYQTLVVIKTRAGVAAELPAKRWHVRKLARSHAFGVLCWEAWL